MRTTSKPVKGVQNYRGCDERRQLSREELFAQFPSLSWSENAWVAALNENGAMIDSLADRFEYLNAQQEKPNMRGKYKR